MDVSEIWQHLISTVVARINMLEQTQTLKCEIIILKLVALILYLFFHEIQYLLSNLVLLIDGNNNPVIECVIYFSRVDINVIEQDKSPGVYKRESVDEDLHLLFKDLALLIVYYLFDHYVAGDDFFKLVQQVGDQAF